MTIAKLKTTTDRVETLAKLYLESQPADISSETISQLCDWLMDEFHQLPLDLQFSEDMRYANAEEMFRDIAQGQVPSLDIQKIIYSEVVLRTAAYLQLGHAADPKIVFL